MSPPPREQLPDLAADAEALADRVLAEDGAQDLTSAVTVSADPAAHARIEVRGSAILAGTLYADAVARAAGCRAEWLGPEGERVTDCTIGGISGPLRGILRAERPLLNLLQRAMGIATLTRRCVDALAGTSCRVLHTRKTAPGLRVFDVAAVVAGGGEVHRLDLAHTVLIKDNHWRAIAGAGRDLGEVLAEARRRGALACQVEVESLEQLDAACDAGAERLLLDNQTPDTVALWAARARRARPGTVIEASGGMTPGTIRAFADAGADFVSLGALTHSVVAPDLALALEQQSAG